MWIIRGRWRSAHVAELLDELLPDREANDAIFRLATAVLGQLKPGVVWAPLTYFELWIVRLTGLLPDLRECTVCGVVLEGVSYFHPLVDGLMCEGDKSWGATELSVDSQRLAAQMLRAPVENFVGCDWERTRAADLRRFLIQRDGIGTSRSVCGDGAAYAGQEFKAAECTARRERAKIIWQKPLTFQELVLRLQGFWAEHGCVLQQPYDVEVGAGTMAPETFLRVLGPKPYRVGYVQPSRRPADGRYGENPNRLFKHMQFQVILKPPPANVQELYLESLEAIGIDLRKHDIRFEEDNWESPTLGAWGIGWQVMLDGLEITQFTYFQQCGGIDLDPISAELTYGLERIAAFLQDVDSIYDITWVVGPEGAPVKYGEIRLQDELQFSVYNFECADVDKAWEHLECTRRSARRCWRSVAVASSET